MPKVTMYSTPYCPYCVMARRLLTQKGVPFEDIDVTGDTEKRRWLVEATGRRTVPQIFVDGRSYGGFDDIAALDRRGQLDHVLGLSPEPA
jgi:glutaredoxin 3